MQVWDYTHDSKQHTQLLKGPAPLVWESESSSCHPRQGPVQHAFRHSWAVPTGGHACCMQQLKSCIVDTLLKALTMLHWAPAHHSRACSWLCLRRLHAEKASLAAGPAAVWASLILLQPDWWLHTLTCATPCKSILSRHNLYPLGRGWPYAEQGMAATRRTELGVHLLLSGTSHVSDRSFWTRTCS